MYSSDGARMIPEPRCAPPSSRGAAVNFGSSDSATFMRKVAEPTRSRSMRARNSAGRSASASSLRIQQFGADVRGDRVALDHAAVFELDAGGATAFDDDAFYRRIGFESDSEAARFGWPWPA